MKPYHFLIVCLPFFCYHTTAQNQLSATQKQPPRIIVSIVVDQLRSDYLEAFIPLYEDGGFRRLLNEGCVFTHAQYPFLHPDRASATACFYTGCSPYDNGVVGEKWLDRTTLCPVYSVYDPHYDGILTDDKSSPRQLCVSTLSDELKLSSDGKSMVFSIAPFRDAAIYSAGHAANAAVWIDDTTGNWCTTSYYGALPAWASSANNTLPLDERIKTPWTPINEQVSQYSYFTSGSMLLPFSHAFMGDDRFIDFKTSGLVNEEVKRVALSCLHDSGIGLGPVPDMLALTFYAGNYRHQSITNMPVEMQDIYVRLDHVIADIINETEAKVGKDRALFVLTSTGYCDEEAPALEKFRIPTGTFSMTRAASLLNMYLGAIYGQERWVETQYNRQIFIDHKLVETKRINLTELLERSSDFLSQMSGIQSVYTRQRLAIGAWTSGIKVLRASINQKFSGDIILRFSPGWQIINEDFDETHFERNNYIRFPLIFMGAGIDANTINAPIEIDATVPTISQYLRIPVPNACSVSPLMGL